jgi:hypothetical protein
MQHLLVILQKAAHFAGGSFTKACSVLRFGQRDWTHFILMAAQDFNTVTHLSFYIVDTNVGSLQSFKRSSNARLTVGFPFSYFYLYIFVVLGWNPGPQACPAHAVPLRPRRLILVGLS